MSHDYPCNWGANVKKLIMDGRQNVLFSSVWILHVLQHICVEKQDSKWAVGVKVSVNGCLCLCVSLATDWANTER